MLVYLIIAAGNLIAYLLGIGWIKVLFPGLVEPTQGAQTGLLVGVMAVYLLLGPFLFLIPSNLKHRQRPFFLFLSYLVALSLVGSTVAFSMEFHRQLLKVQIPLVIQEPAQITFFFIGLYLPATLFFCYLLMRFSETPAAYEAGWTPSQKANGARTDVKPKTETTATLVRPGLENLGGIPETPETIEISMLKQIQDQFSVMSGLSLQVFDARGDMPCQPSRENPICQAVQLTSGGRDHCQSHCGRDVKLALVSHETIFSKCKMNLHVFSIPVILEDQTRWVLQGGKTYFQAEEWETGQRTAEPWDLTAEDLTHQGLPPRIKPSSDMAEACRFLETLFPPLFAALHKKNHLNTRLARLMTLFSLLTEYKQDPSSSIHILLNTVGVLFNLNTAAIFSREPDGSTFKTEAAFGQKVSLIQNVQVKIGHSAIRDVMERKAPVSISERAAILKAGFPESFTSIHLLPLFTFQEETTSLLCILDTPLGEDDLGVISAYCQQVSLIQENSRLRKDQVTLAKDISVMLEIARTVGSELDSSELFSSILEKSTKFLRAEQGSLMLLDEDRDELAVKAVKGLNKNIAELLRIRPGEGISGKVLSSGDPLMVADLERDPRIAQAPRTRYKTLSFISIPLKINNRTIGILNISDKINGEVFAEEDLHLLTSIGAYASVAIERSKLHQRAEELKKISITDVMTGLLNRRYFQERVSEEMERSRRHNLPLSLIMIDIDDFKSINDALGHPAGDEALKITARCIRSSIRTIDVAARYGGEEFTVILPQTLKSDAHIIAERICTEVQKMDFTYGGNTRRFRMSVSLGLATFPEDAADLENLVRNADTAMYSAKSQGKNQVVLYGKSVARWASSRKLNKESAPE